MTVDREEALLCALHIHVTTITKGLFSNRALHELVGKGLNRDEYETLEWIKSLKQFLNERERMKIEKCSEEEIDKLYSDFHRNSFRS